MIYFITCSLIWGLTWIAIKYQLHAVDPNVAVFYRFFVASLVMFALCLAKKERIRFLKEDHFRFFGQGLFMFSLNFLLTYWASQMAPSALVALAFTSLIYFNMFGARIFLRLPFQKSVFLGGLISLVGMAFVSYNELDTMELHPTSLMGFYISIVATFSASIGNLLATKNRQLKIPILSNNAWGMFYGCLISFGYSLFAQKSFAIQFDYPFVISFIYLTLFGTIISFWAYLKLIDQIGPAKAAFTSVISPVIAIIISNFVENMALTTYLLIGVSLCLIGNVVALTRKEWFLKKVSNAN